MGNITVEDIGLKLGTILKDTYTIHKYIAMGHIGIVYEAHDKDLNKVLIKEFCPYSLANRDLNGLDVIMKSEHNSQTYEDAKKTFQMECRIVKDLRRLPGNMRNHVVYYIDSFEENQTCYLVQRFEEGTDLLTLLQRENSLQFKKISKELIRIVRNIHRIGILHRDIKPSNILINPDGTMVLIDFGSACYINRDQGKVRMVSKGYSAEELYTGSKCSKKTDIYSIGVLMYYLMTGVLPDSADVRKCKDEIQPLWQYQDVPAVLNHYVKKAMKVEQKKRLGQLWLLQLLLI